MLVCLFPTLSQLLQTSPVDITLLAGIGFALQMAEWTGRYDVDFDNIFHATLTLFEVASLEMWPDIMLYSVDTQVQTTHAARGHSHARLRGCWPFHNEVELP